MIPNSASIWLTAALVFASLCPGAAGERALCNLERSYWLHASLGVSLVKGYWAPEALVGSKPTAGEVRRAASLLTGHYGANRLYLIYHKEVPVSDFTRLLRVWRNACPRGTVIVPTFLLRMYDKAQTQVFTRDELLRLCRMIRNELSIRTVAVYDVMPNRDQGDGLVVLAREFPNGLIRVGIQPEESIDKPYIGAVQDTWSGLCAGKTDDDWKQPGFGAEQLLKWVRERNRQQKPVAWDLVAVAWDYSATQQGDYPGYDDAAKNMPLPLGRNRAAAELVLREASASVLSGFSSDLLILDSNSRHPMRDGAANSFYQCLKKGEVYRGYFAEPLEEIAAIFRGLRDGRFGFRTATR